MRHSDLPNLSARQLRAILAIAENRSFIAAAADLKISQPALTRTIKQIEVALGLQLFSRTTRQVAATPAGKEFVALAERLLNDLKIGIDGLRKHGAQQRGQVIVSSVLLFSDARLPGLIASYQKKYPGIDIQLREGIHGNVLDDVRSGVADFGVTYLNTLPDTFVVDALGVEALHVVLPASHALARKKKIEIADLKAETFVSYPAEAHTRRLVDGMAAAAGFAPRCAVTVSRAVTLMNMVRNGIGIAIVPSSERPSPTDRRITSRPLARTPISRIGIFHLRERELTAPAVELVTVMKEWIRIVAPKRLRAAWKSS